MKKIKQGITYEYSRNNEQDIIDLVGSENSRKDNDMLRVHNGQIMPKTKKKLFVNVLPGDSVYRYEDESIHVFSKKF